MRHFAGVLLGIVLLPVFFALNWLVNLAEGRAAGGGRTWLLALLGAYALVGLVAGLCLAWRKLSPTALLLGGALIVAAEVLLNLPALAGFQVNVPQLYAHAPITGGRLLVVVGVALFVGGLLPTRWHRPVPRRADEDVTGTGYDAHDDAQDDGHRDDSAYTTELLGRPAGYESWGSGRNEYADEPEQGYSSPAQSGAAASSPATGGQGGEPQASSASADDHTVAYPDQRYSGSSHADTGSAGSAGSAGSGSDSDRAYGVDAYDDRTQVTGQMGGQGGEPAYAEPDEPTHPGERYENGEHTPSR